MSRVYCRVVFMRFILFFAFNFEINLTDFVFAISLQDCWIQSTFQIRGKKRLNMYTRFKTSKNGVKLGLTRGVSLKSNMSKEFLFANNPIRLWRIDLFCSQKK
jgi:hypothetical protein